MPSNSSSLGLEMACKHMPLEAGQVLSLLCNFDCCRRHASSDCRDILQNLAAVRNRCRSTESQRHRPVSTEAQNHDIVTTMQQ